MPNHSAKANKDETDDAHRTLGFWSVFFLGIGMQFKFMSGGWNDVIDQGIGQSILSICFVSALYLLLVCSVAEMTSVIDFAGGSFAYCRCTLGPLIGFLVGASDILQTNFFAANISHSFSHLIEAVFHIEAKYVLLVDLIFYSIILTFLVKGGSLLWKVITACGIIAIFFTLMYLFGCISVMDTEKYAVQNPESPTNDGFAADGSLGFIEGLVDCTWFFLGVEILPLTSSQVLNPRVTIPHAMLACQSITLIISLWLFVTLVSVAPGIVAELEDSAYPLSYGYHEFLGISMQYAPLLCLVPLLSSGLGFMYVSSYQALAMANSGLLPKAFAYTWGENKAPIVALATSFLFQYIQHIIAYFIPDYELPYYTICIIGACLVYVGLFCAFIVFKTKFTAMPRQYTSPFGVTGAVVGMGCALTLFISAAGYSDDNVTACSAYFILIACMIAFYYGYVQYHQFFSKEEQEKFMKAFIVNLNTAKRNRKSPQNILPAWMTSWVPSWLSCNASKFFSGQREKNTTSALVVVGGRSTDKKSSANLKHDQVIDESVALANLAAATTSATPTQHQQALSPVVEGDEEGIRAAEGTAPTATKATASSRQSILRRSGLAWSGKVMTNADSRKFFELLQQQQQHDGDDEDLLLGAGDNTDVKSVARNNGCLHVAADAGDVAGCSVEEAILVARLDALLPGVFILEENTQQAQQVASAFSSTRLTA